MNQHRLPSDIIGLAKVMLIKDEPYVSYLLTRYEKKQRDMVFEQQHRGGKADLVGGGHLAHPEDEATVDPAEQLEDRLDAPKGQAPDLDVHHLAVAQADTGRALQAAQLQHPRPALHLQHRQEGGKPEVGQRSGERSR